MRERALSREEQRAVLSSRFPGPGRSIASGWLLVAGLAALPELARLRLAELALL